MSEIIITGDWDGRPIWRYRTAREKLLELINDNDKKTDRKDNDSDRVQTTKSMSTMRVRI